VAALTAGVRDLIKAFQGASEKAMTFAWLISRERRF